MAKFKMQFYSIFVRFKRIFLLQNQPAHDALDETRPDMFICQINWNEEWRLYRNGIYLTALNRWADSLDTIFFLICCCCYGRCVFVCSVRKGQSVLYKYSMVENFCWPMVGWKSEFSRLLFLIYLIFFIADLTQIYLINLRLELDLTGYLCSRLRIGHWRESPGKFIG